MASDLLIPFEAHESLDASLVGGKGANLGKLAQQNEFRVPPGFTLSTRAYAEFLRHNALEDCFATLSQPDLYSNPDYLDQTTYDMRQILLKAQIPDSLRDPLQFAYSKLEGAYVAVRSSGTMEDLAEASFAGLHDTILDVKGFDNLLASIKECWASLFSSRAVSYRQRNGYDHSEAKLAVVIQIMVESEASGVLFTANPLTSATHECVINSSFGLGEAVVSSLVTPDTFYVSSKSSKIRAKELGTKEYIIQRDTQKGFGTMQTSLDNASQSRFSLTDEQVLELVGLGLRVQDYYGGLPQDIEWGFEKGNFYLLQSRPITGVDFSWDEDITGSDLVEYDEDAIFTRAWADEIWTGGCSPLFFSVRAWTQNVGFQNHRYLWKVEEMFGKSFFKYHKGEVYYNCSIERGMLETLLPPAFRTGALGKVPPIWHQSILEKPFSWLKFARIVSGIELAQPAFYRSYERINGYWHKKWKELKKDLRPEKFHRFTDTALVTYTDWLLSEEVEWIHDGWSMLFVYGPTMISLLAWIVNAWCDREHADLFSTLVSGNPVTTQTQKSDRALWELAQRVRSSPFLSQIFRKNEDDQFFEACKRTEEGQKWLSDYKAFSDDQRHRGHPDRDIWYKRRGEDASIDYRAITAILNSSNTVHPKLKEHELNQRREEATQRVISNLRAGYLGLFKAELFKVVYDWYLQFQSTRDDFRADNDILTYGWRLAYNEIGRRLRKRGVFQEEDDHFWLSRTELYPVLFGAPLTPLLKLKMDARKKNFMRRLNREVEMPMYLQYNTAVDLEPPSEDEYNVLKGIGTSKGKVQGIAAVVKHLKDIGKVPDRAILVVNSTDPGWVPVFGTISAIVLETGGLLAHGSCMAREYGIAGCQIRYAMSKIRDGERIEVDGDKGIVRLLDREP